MRSNHLVLYFLLSCLLTVHSATLNAQNAPIRIESVNFEGNRSVSSGQLKAAMRMSQEGFDYSSANLQSDLQRIENIYRNLGFLNVQLEAPDVRIHAAEGGKTAIIRIVVNEGPRYTTGKLAVKDARALDPETLMQICPLQKGQPYSPVKAAQWREKVEDSYRSMGYLKASCPLRENINEFGNTVDCTMECTEGRIYTVRKIAVAGNTSVNPAELKKRLLFSEGGVFNPEMLSLSIQFLNQARIYEPISGSDVEIRIDDENGVVDVLLRVVPRAH